jgi:hypothetical protein
MMPSRLEKPSISVRIWLSVCSCSLVPPKPEHRAAARADRVDLVDEQDRRRLLAGLLEGSRTRAAPTPTIISTNSAALIEKNGTPPRPPPRAPAASCRAGRADQQHRPWAPCRRARCTCRATQEVDDLDTVRLGLVDAGDVVEGLPLVGLGVVPARLALADAHHSRRQAADPARAPVHPHIERDDQLRPAEAEQPRPQPLPWRIGTALILDARWAIRNDS